MRRVLAIVAVALLTGVVLFLVLRSTDDQRYGATGTVLASREHGPELCLGGVLESYPPQCGGLPLVGWEWEDLDDEQAASGTTWVDVYVEGTFDGKRFTLTSPPGPPRRVDVEDPSFAPACDDPKALDPGDGIREWEEATQADDGAINTIPGLAAIWVSDPSGPGWDGPFVANVVVRPGSRADAERIVRRYWRGNLCLVERDQKTVRELDDIMERLDDVLTQDVLTASPNYQRGVIEATIVVVDDKSRAEVDGAFGKGVVDLTGELKPL